MAGTWGFALKGLAGGLTAGLPAMMARKERERLEKEKKEAARIFQVWYSSDETKEFCANLDTASQGERAYFISGLLRIKKELFDYWTEIDNDIRDGDIAAAKQKNDLVEAKLKVSADLAEQGMRAVFPDGSPMKISDEDLAFQKKLRMGEVAGGPTAEAMMKQTWETQVEKPLDIRAEERAPTAIDQKIAGINALPIPEDQKLEMKIKVYGGGDSAYEQQVRDYLEAGGTEKGIRERFERGAGIDIVMPPTISAVKSTKQMFDDAKTEEQWNEAIFYNKQTDKPVDPPYGGEWKGKLMIIIQEEGKWLEGLLDENGKLRDPSLKEDWGRYVSQYTKRVLELMKKYPDVDLSQFPKFIEWSWIGWGSLVDEKGW